MPREASTVSNKTMEIAPEPLTKWIVRMFTDITEEGSPDRFELFHTVDSSAERLGKYKVKEGDSASELAQLIYDEARHDADTRENRYQRYTVCLYRSESQSEPEVQYPFRIQPRPGTSWSGGDSEQPTEKGERAQLMRMQNDGHQIIMRMAETFGGRMAAEVERVSRMNRDYEEKLRKQAADFEDLQDRRLDRDLERAKVQQQQKFYGDVVSSLIPLLPVIASGLTSKLIAGKGKDKNGHESEVAKSLIPANAELSSRGVMLRELFANMDQKEQQGVMEAIKPLHRMVLMTLAQQLSNATTDIERVAFDTGMQKFMKGLEGPEIMGILGALDMANRNRFMLVYQSYGKSEEEAQADAPDLFKDQPAEEDLSPES